MPYLSAGLQTDVDIEDISPRRDYKMAYIFGCLSCIGSRYEGSPVTIFLHRTAEDLKLQKNNVYQICIRHHITRPHKQCTKCGREYSVDSYICLDCEQIVADIAKCEVYIEEALKAAAKIEKQYKRKKIQESEYSSKIQDLYEGINIARKELEKIEEAQEKKQ